MGFHSKKDFNAAMNRYLKKLNYGKEKPGELNEDEFVKFWADLYALFDKIDKNGGFWRQQGNFADFFRWVYKLFRMLPVSSGKKNKASIIKKW